MSNKQKKTCWRCGYALRETDYMHESICPGCRTPARVCRSCQYFSNNLPNQCSEPSANVPANKQGANTCAFFKAS